MARYQWRWKVRFDSGQLRDLACSGKRASLYRRRFDNKDANRGSQSEPVHLRRVPHSADHRIHLSIGSVLPDFEFTDFTGAYHHLSELKAKFILLDFWATWCVPCMEDLPVFKKTYAVFHPQGFEILGMNGDEIPAKPEGVIQRMEVPWQ
jgi:AhpC/TSA family protein